MKRLFGYIRVSTTKQAEKGVSLKEQRAAIQAYANKRELRIVDWYEEHITAAKRGRPLFTAMLRALRQGKAEGIIIHKIDRSARNLGDWADLGELIDAGFDIHFAHEPLDLRSRGGRLSADILAVVAADFIRNNRQEARKGFDGRLKDGIYPLGAPIGYLDQGKGGKVKIIDPVRGPLVRYAFERYAAGDIGLNALLDDLRSRGLTNRKGKMLTQTGLTTILRNPFYAGVIRLLKTRQTFNGIHEPLIRLATFRHVQEVLDGKRPRRTQVHDYLYRRLFACATCGRSLIGSTAKGRVYYRCSVMSCPTTCVREDILDTAILRTFASICLTDDQVATCRTEIEAAQHKSDEDRQASNALLTGRLGGVESRLARLTDAYVDGGLPKDAYEERRSALVVERQEVVQAIADREPDDRRRNAITVKCVELARNPAALYAAADRDEKRRLLRIITSNRLVNGKDVEIAIAEPFSTLARARVIDLCALQRVRSRTLRDLSRQVFEWMRANNDRVEELLALFTPDSDPETLAA